MRSREGTNLYRERLRPQFHFSSRGVEQRPQRSRLLSRRVSPVLPAQPVRLGMGQYALGPRGQPRPGALARARRRACPRRNGADVQRLGGGRLEEHQRFWQGRPASPGAALHRLGPSDGAVPRVQHRRPYFHQVCRESDRASNHGRQPRPQGNLARANAAMGDGTLRWTAGSEPQAGRERTPGSEAHHPLPDVARLEGVDRPEPGRGFLRMPRPLRAAHRRGEIKNDVGAECRQQSVHARAL